jgi:hypothetical protein
MMRFALLSPILLLAAAPLAASEEVPFEPSTSVFADASACKAHIVAALATARASAHVAAEGPYEIAAGDVRAHLVLVAGSGHRITEHRCLAEKLSSRTWRHSMDGSGDEEPATIETMAAKAEWLKKTPKR